MNKWAFSLVAATLGFLSPLFSQTEQVVVLGGGIGALTSALYLSRASLSPLVVEGENPGGALTLSESIQNWPGEVEISGFELTEKIHKQAELYGARFSQEEVIAVDFSKRPFKITLRALNGSGERTIEAQSCIIAVGAKPNFLGVPGEQTYWTRGVYNCAVCDGGLFKDKIVAVVGGGDSAILEAHYLSKIAETVHLIVRKSDFRGSDELRKREVLSNPKIIVHYNTEVSEIKGNGTAVKSVSLKSKEKFRKEELSVDGLFLAIGASPNTQLFQNQLELDSSGYIILKKDQQTSIDGIYAIGDVANPKYKQAISAAGDGAVAALQAESYCASHHSSSPNETKKIAAKPESAPQNVVVEITSLEQFQKELAASSVPVVIDFYATWCSPCKRLSPIFHEWAAQYYGKVRFFKVNVDKNRPLVEKYQIQSMPTLVVLDTKGELLTKKVGGGNMDSFKDYLERIKKQSEESEMQ